MEIRRVVAFKRVPIAPGKTATGFLVMEKSWNLKFYQNIMEKESLSGKLAICTIMKCT